MTPYAHAIVKGTPEDAAKAAHAQHVSVLRMEVLTPGREVKLTVPHEDYQRLQEWYLADSQSQAPYPAGTLLFFTAEREAA